MTYVKLLRPLGVVACVMASGFHMGPQNPLIISLVNDTIAFPKVQCHIMY